jgi:hypothetical protein
MRVLIQHDHAHRIHLVVSQLLQQAFRTVQIAGYGLTHAGSVVVRQGVEQEGIQIPPFGDAFEAIGLDEEQ